MFKCQFCTKESSVKASLIRHQNACCNNPNRIYTPSKNGYTKSLETGVPYIISDDTRRKIGEANKLRNISQETKNKISISRKKYLEENPDKVPYLLNHYSKGPSYPEKYWSEILIKHKIPFDTEYRVWLYSLDFKIGMVDLEIDGEQHYLDNKIIESDLRRNSYLESLGYKIIRIRWKDFKILSKDNREIFVKNLIVKIKCLTIAEQFG